MATKLAGMHEEKCSLSSSGFLCLFRLLVGNSANLISKRAKFQASLHDWYHRHARALPWREAPSLYKTVVSEFMLQQTQVITVLPYFARWLQELPDFSTLAAAPESKVMKLWEGLGYYSRARNLHKLAKILATLPSPPRTPAEWQELPGVGPYTSAAITSISFGEPSACVDGNVVRILARLTGEDRPFRDGSEAAKHFSPLAHELIKNSDAGMHNQAMMELGATVCLRQNPRCLVCPVAKFCVARATGAPENFPRLKPKLIEQREVTRLWCVHENRLLLHRTHAQARRLAGLHELPESGLLTFTPDKTALLLRKRRAITRYQITESIYRVKPTSSLLKEITANKALEWIPLAELADLTLSGPHRRWVGKLLSATP